MSQSSGVIALYPHLESGLCGALECPRICSRVCHCPAGLRLSHRRLAEQALRRFTTKSNSQQRRVCEQVRTLNLCPSLCQQCGGCFLPQSFDSEAELKRKAHRPQYVIDASVRLRRQQASKEART